MEFLQKYDIIPGIVPADLQTAQSGDYISMKGCEKVAVVFFKAAGTAGDDPTLTLRQATSVGGGSVKDLACIDEYYIKQGTLTAVEQFTKTTQTAAATIAMNATSAESQALVVFEVDAASLDVANGFDCIVVNVGDVGTNAQLGCLLYIPQHLRYAGELPQSAIVD